jgi:hypothetical protein
MNTTPEETLKRAAVVFAQNQQEQPQNQSGNRVDVAEYLSHYGKFFKVKQNGTGTLYCLETCLFDPSHVRESSIIEGADGVLRYQCFHDSCQGRTWKEARVLISGADSLAPFIKGQEVSEPDTKMRDTAEPCLKDTAIPEHDPLNFPNIMAGAAGDFARVYSASMEPPPHFFFMAYLACLGNIAAGRLALRSELSTEPRLYLLILGESADDRKSTAISKTVSFFREAVMDFPVCFGIGSAEGLQKKLEEGTRLLLCFDEFRAFTSKCKIDGSVLMPCVTTLFESRHYESHTAKKSVKINNSSLSIIAASTIDTYEQIFDEHFLSIGFPNRVFLCPGKGQRRFSLPEKILDSNRKVLFDQIGLLLKHIEKTVELEITPDARLLYHDWYMALPQSLHTKRLDTYAMRFMPLLAVNELKDVVDVEIVRKVIALCNWQYEARRRYDPIDADSQMARTEERIRRVLLSGAKTKRDIGRAVHVERVGTWIFDTALTNLLKAENIILDKRSKLYRLI